MAYKRFDIVVEAFSRMGLALKVIGRGPEFGKLKKMAKSNVEFLGRVSDEELRQHFAQCQALIFPQEEDFGITAIEAMAAGTPLIAYRGGDIPEHVEEGKTGIFFDEQTAESIMAAVKKFDAAHYDAHYIRNSVLKFDKSLFKAKIKDYVEREYNLFKEEG